MCEYINGTIIQEDFTMEKTIYNESNGLWYELQGDYYIPCLTVPAEEEKPIGIWGRREQSPPLLSLLTNNCTAYSEVDIGRSIFSAQICNQLCFGVWPEKMCCFVV